MLLGEKLKTIEDFIYRSAKQSFGVFGVDADPALALMVMESATSRFRQDAYANALNSVFNLEDKLEQIEKENVKEKPHEE